MKRLRTIVVKFVVAWRWKIVRFVTDLQEKAESTLTSGQKWPKKSEKSDMNPFYDHKESKIRKFSSVASLYHALAFWKSPWHIYANYGEDFVAKSFGLCDDDHRKLGKKKTQPGELEDYDYDF